MDAAEDGRTWIGEDRGIMKIGLFDHVEAGERPVAQLSTSGIEFAARRRRRPASIACMSPSIMRRRSIWCRCRASISPPSRARPSTCGSGRWSICLPLYSPLRLIEEICMLDHLSHGRLDIGVGRGVSPYELEFHNVMHDELARHFLRGLRLRHDRPDVETFSFKSGRYIYNDVPIALTAVAAAASAVLVRIVERRRLDLGRRARAALRDAGRDRDGQGQHRRPSRPRWPSAARRRNRSRNLPAAS